MSRKQIIEGNFTLCPESIIEKHGLITAAVFGRIWFYCGMKEKNCHAKVATIAKSLKLSRLTVMRHIKVLLEYGYILDETPTLRNHPHTYRVTDLVNMRIESIAVTVSEKYSKR